MPDIQVVVPDPAVKASYHAFDEIALTLVGGLRRLGAEVVVGTSYLDLGVPTILLSPYVYDDDVIDRLPANTILYNWEQLGDAGTHLVTPAQVLRFSRFIVWDYSAKNVAFWRARGAANVVHVPLGYDPGLEILPPVVEPTYDVVFFGSLNDRRQHIITQLRQRGLDVAVVRFGFGPQRDAALRTANLALNIHSYDVGILELARLSLLWANHVPVVSEANPNTEVPFGMGEVGLFAPYGALVDAVVDALADPAGRAEATEAAYARFRSVGDAATVLGDALSVTLQMTEARLGRQTG